MVSKDMYELGSNKSTIREIFEYGQKRIREIGRENVFDFSIGNPNVPCPASVNESIIKLANQGDSMVHGYTPAAGLPELRSVIADYIASEFNFKVEGSNVFVTSGAAHGLTATIKALSCEGDQFVTFAPYFPEYKCFVESTGARFDVVKADIEEFQINFDELERTLTENIKAVIINSPNNPCGVVYRRETIEKLADFLRNKQREYGHAIYLISDEPYRDIVFEGAEVPYVPAFYDNTVVLYSYSKSLSIPGERIGYIMVSPKAEESEKIVASIAGATRIMGHVNPPSLIQRVIIDNINTIANIDIYEKNRDLLYKELISIGFKCVKPGGAFYLFPRSLGDDSREFCKRAMKHDILIVPGDDFGCEGHFRLSYCVATDVIKRAIPKFRELAEEYL